MKICLKTQAKEAKEHQVVVNLQERLPSHVMAPCQLTCNFQVQLATNYYLLSYKVSGEVRIICQRCLQVFHYDYSNETKLAVCANDTIAENVMEQFESVVVSNNEIDLSDVLTDDLYLYIPEKHLVITECDSEIRQLIQ